MLNYMLNYMLKSYYMLHYMPTTCSITCSITCHYMQHNPITCQLHAQLHDSLHTQLPTITCIAWHEPMITWFLEDSRRRLRRLMRGLLERILLSCPKHENTGLESVRIMKHGRSNSSPLRNETWAEQFKLGWRIQSTAKLKMGWRIQSPDKWVGESNPPR